MPIMPPPNPTTRRRLLAALAAAWMAAAPSMAAAAIDGDDSPGARIYAEQCAECHGPEGQGSEVDYPYPLEGERSVDGLTAFVDQKMPPGFAEECVGEDAEAVARYVYDAFYSEIAQARNAPPRIELARLTVRQYRNALADLVGSFRWDPERSEERGLQAEYYDGRRFRGKNRVIERVDPEVRFDFGTESPDPDNEDFENPNLFAIRWEGSVLPAESGDFEFIVRTEHALRLWVNDSETPLIDGWVQSGDMTEHRATLPLLEGHAYPIKLEFSKADQGVDKDREQEPEIPASIRLEWVRPRSTAEVIPSRHLSPKDAPAVFVSTAPFPPDDRSVGFERGTSVSSAWEEATTEGAIEAAGYVAEHLDQLAGIGRDDSEERRLETRRDFAARFVERAFRHPLSDEQRQLYVDRQFDAAPDTETAVKRVVLLTLKSPRFLYLDVDGDLDSYDVASRIAFTLWDAPPDIELLKAAAEDRLGNVEAVAEQARRMLGDPRAHATLRAFFLKWLKVESTPDLAKAPEAYPDFDDAVIADLRTSLELFLDDVAWGNDPDFRRLLLDQELFLNGRLAAFYGVERPEDAPFEVVEDPEVLGERAGVLAHPYLLANFAYTSTTSPIHRGVFLARNVLGQGLRPPPAAFAPLAPDLHPDLTTRERVSLQTSPESCMSCHGMINPLGFALERFDAVGRFRESEHDTAIDATGFFETRVGDRAEFEGARGLAEFLAESEEVHEAFVEQAFHHLVKQPIRAFGPEVLPELTQAFVDSGFDLRGLLVEIAARSALTPRRPEPIATASHD